MLARHFKKQLDSKPDRYGFKSQFIIYSQYDAEEFTLPLPYGDQGINLSLFWGGGACCGGIFEANLDIV